MARNIALRDPRWEAIAATLTGLRQRRRRAVRIVDHDVPGRRHHRSRNGGVTQQDIGRHVDFVDQRAERVARIERHADRRIAQPHRGTPRTPDPHRRPVETPAFDCGETKRAGMSQRREQQGSTPAIGIDDPHRPAAALAQSRQGGGDRIPTRIAKTISKVLS